MQRASSGVRPANPAPNQFRNSQSLLTRPAPNQFRNSQSLPTRCPPWMPDFGNQKGKKSKRCKIIMWEHEFICLADTRQTIPPSPLEKAELINAGLGPKKIICALLYQSKGYTTHTIIYSSSPDHHLFLW